MRSHAGAHLELNSPIPRMPDYRNHEEELSASYNIVAEQYRRDDEIEVQSENHRRLCGNLARMSGSFGREIDVLDAGCGTGRHFHCLSKVRRLVGLDISMDMLHAAANPVHRADVMAGEIQLIRGSIYQHAFPAESFDLIYSLGVFGHGAKVTADLCANFRRWLRPGGLLYFNVIETSVDPTPVAVRRKLRKLVYPMLPRPVQQRLDEREARYPVFHMRHDELAAVVSEGGFKNFTLSLNICRTPLWKGVHLECRAQK